MSKPIPKHFKISRGEIWTADLGSANTKEGEQRGFRPVLVLQNDKGNKYSGTTIVACITSEPKKELDVHAYIKLSKPSIILLEQIKTISKTRLYEYLGKVNNEELHKIEEKLKVSLGLS